MFPAASAVTIAIAAGTLPGLWYSTVFRFLLIYHKLLPMPSNLSIRIQSIQKKIGVSETGSFDVATCRELIHRAGQASSSTNQVTLTKMVQRIVGADDDGVVGPETLTKVEAFISTALPKLPPGGSLVVSSRSLDMIVFYEVTSKEVYDKKFQTPQWPGGASGVTIGIGYDLGHFTGPQITDNWGPHVSVGDLALLISVKGKTGEPARLLIPTVKSVKINFDKAIKVFYQCSLPEFAKKVKKTFPGVEKLPPDAQGVLLSLVYNRGTSLEGEHRKEMKNIVPLVAKGDLAGIAAELRSMKRLWPNFKGLRDRRDKEAALLESAGFDMRPEDLVVV